MNLNIFDLIGVRISPPFNKTARLLTLSISYSSEENNNG